MVGNLQSSIARRVHGVPTSPESFQVRKILPESWCGLRDADLDRAVGIDGCVFVHRNGFIGGHSSLDGALSMAKRALSK